jgi:endonuclease YncB( thermonuclease family)
VFKLFSLFRRRSAWRYLVLILIGLSIYEYQQNGAVTWYVGPLRELRELFYDYIPGADAPSETPPGDLSGRVTAVADGDTFTLRLQGRRDLRVRLYGIDAPESNQPYGPQARAALSEKLLGEDVNLVLQDVDNYGRLVSTVYFEGRDINLEQVQSGLAWWYSDYAPDDRALRDAEAVAQRGKVGLWKDAKPVAPWEWRRR